MSDSILTSVKKILGIDASYTVFDTDIMMHINTAFGTLSQLGVGPIEGFSISDATPTWDTYLGNDPRLNMVKSYICLRVRFLFDPPGTSYLIEAQDKQIKEFEWRINALVDPGLVTDIVYDGGSP